MSEGTGGGPDPGPDTDADPDTGGDLDTDTGGDPACWLNRVCENCGRFIDDRDADACPVCGAHREPHNVSIRLDDL